MIYILRINYNYNQFTGWVEIDAVYMLNIIIEICFAKKILSHVNFSC